MSVPRPFLSARPPPPVLLFLALAALSWGPRGAGAFPRARREAHGDGEGPGEPPAPVSKLALFPDRPAWCETRNITQIISHAGCTSTQIDNRVCLGQCYSYSVPDTLPQTSESLLHCDSCTPSETTWDVVTLQCGDDYSDGGDTEEEDGGAGSPEVTKLVEKILRCECQACGAQQHLLLAAAAGPAGVDGEGHAADPLLASMAGSAPRPDREPEPAGEPARGLPHNPEFAAARGDDDGGETEAAAERRRPAADERAREREGPERVAASGAAEGSERHGERRRDWEPRHKPPRQHPPAHRHQRQRHGAGENLADPDRPAAGLWAGEEYGGL